MSTTVSVIVGVRPSFFLFFCFTDFFSQQVLVGGRNENKNKIHSDRFPVELNRRKHTKSCFLLFQFNWKMVRMYFIFIIPISSGAVTGGNLIKLAAVEKTK